MPSGYTDEIAKGVSFEQFALRCARAFGALISMREDSFDAEIPDEIKPSQFHLDLFNEVTAKLITLKHTTVEQADEKAKTDFYLEQENYEKRIREKRELRDTYKLMLAKVRDWEPPSADHVELKNFMVKQIEDSIKWDCDEIYMKPPILMSGIEWLKNNIDACMRDIEYYAKEYKAEIKRCEDRSKWIQQLKKSLR